METKPYFCLFPSESMRSTKPKLLFEASCRSFSFFFLPLPRLVRTISLGRVPSWIPGGIFPGDEASRSAGRLSLANVEGRAKRIKAGAGSGAIIQSSGQLGSIVLIAFHGGRCRQESILSLGLTLSMLHTMSFIINVTGTFQSEGSSTTAEISSPGCSSNLDRIDRYGGGELIHSGRILLDTFASFVLSECITLFRLRWLTGLCFLVWRKIILFDRKNLLRLFRQFSSCDWIFF